MGEDLKRMNQKSNEAKELYQMRIKIRLDGRFCVVLSNEKLAYKITMDKKGGFHIFPHDKEWDYKMIHEEGIQDYLSELLKCLEAYQSEVKVLYEYQDILGVAFNKKPTI